MLKGSTFIVKYNKSYQLAHLILWQQSIMFDSGWFETEQKASLGKLVLIDKTQKLIQPGLLLLTRRCPEKFQTMRKL